MKKRTSERTFFILVLVIITVLGFCIRYFLRQTQTLDFNIFLNSWYETIKQVGWKSIAGEFSEYSPPYIYLLFLVHQVFPALTNVTAVKLPAILADFVNAILGMGIVYSITKSRVLSLLCFTSLFLAPTIFINSAYWGQADSIYTCAVLATIWCILQKKPALSLFAFGIAFAVKLQAIFIAPFILALALTGFFTWKSILAFPLSIFLSYLPAWLAGRPAQDLLSIYFQQANAFPYLTMNAASAYAWFDNAVYATVAPAGILFTAGICLVYIALIFYRKKSDLESRDLVLLAALSSVLVPFFLPAMHDRYFYLLDVTSILLLFCCPKLFYIPILAQLTSFFSYQFYLFEKALFPLFILSFGNFIILVMLSREMILSLYPPGTNHDTTPSPVS